MSARQVLLSAREWTFRTSAVREARARIVDLGDRRERALGQARLLLEVARRVKYPTGRLPKGARPAVLARLYRDAIYWALVARRPGDAPPPADVPALWAEYPHDEMARAAGGTAALEGARRALFETPAAAIDVSAEDAARAGALATNLVGDLDAARNRADRLVAQRWLRVLLVLAVLVGLAAGARRLLLGRSLTTDVTMRVSSSWSGCAFDPPCGALMFHTEPEPNPWVELDLGMPKTIHRIEISNREDCCGERAIPLIVEVSTDRAAWTEVGRRDSEFTSWVVTLRPRTVRYVKLRVPRHTTFHLKDVVIR